MAYVDRTTLARSAQFVARVQHAMMKSAVLVLGQATPDAKQLALAKIIIAEPERNAQTFAFGVVTVETITAESSDADLQAAVNEVLTKYAK